MVERRSRLPGRLARHYLPLGLATAVATIGLAQWLGAAALTYRWSTATALVGLGLFALSLAIGPVALLVRGRLLPVSTDLRRDVGILAGILMLAHVALGLLVYPDVRAYFVYPVAEWPRVGLPLRLDDFGVANWSGLAATLVVVLLLVTSGDWALRRYGARRWKHWQRLGYWAFGLVFVHGAVYQRLDPHDTHALVLAFGLLVFSVAVLQGAGVLSYGRARRTPRLLAGH